MNIFKIFLYRFFSCVTSSHAIISTPCSEKGIETAGKKKLVLSQKFIQELSSSGKKMSLFQELPGFEGSEESEDNSRFLERIKVIDDRITWMYSKTEGIASIDEFLESVSLEDLKNGVYAPWTKIPGSVRLSLVGLLTGKGIFTN